MRTLTLLSVLVFFFSCKKKRNEDATSDPTPNPTQEQCRLIQIKSHQSVPSSTFVMYNDLGQIIRMEERNEAGVFTDSSHYADYTYKGNLLITEKGNLFNQGIIYNEEPSNSVPFYSVQHYYEGDKLIKSETFKENPRVLINTDKYFYSNQLLQYRITNDRDSMVYSDYNVLQKAQTIIVYLRSKPGDPYTLGIKNKFEYNNLGNIVKELIVNYGPNDSVVHESSYTYDLSLNASNLNKTLIC